ncbi:MAG: D-alanyl-D-alanine carboxypeptidase family protein [Angelakisella sp.]
MMGWKRRTISFLAALLLAASTCVGAAAEALPGDALPMGEQDGEVGEVSVPVYKIERETKQAASFVPGTPLPVKSAILMEQDSGRVLYEQNSGQKLAPASVTKIMSLLLVMEALDSGKIALTDTVTCSDTAAAYGGSQIWLKPGEQMTVEELLKATAIASANDATVCLAEYVAGSELAFVDQMNRRAAALGMTDTAFRCAAGLDNEGHLTTARDVALMSRELMKHPAIQNYTTIWMDSLRNGATQLVNTNRMVRFYEGATGLKTGTTSGAGSCLSATAQRDGLQLIAVIMGAETSDLRFSAARSLLDWGYANYMQAKLSPPDGLEPVKVSGGIAPSVAVRCLPPDGVVIEKNKAERLKQELTLQQELKAPVLEGQQLGTVRVSADGELLLEYPVCAANEVSKMTLTRALGILWGSLLRCD